jgi:hypothetical protein
MRCAYLLNLSTTIKITSFPFDLGSLSIKPMLISTKKVVGMGKGCNIPGDFTFSALFC